MLLKLYPKVHRRYTSLPVLGSLLDGYATWLIKHGYATDCVREHLKTARRLDRALQRRGVRCLRDLTRGKLRACAPARSADGRNLAAVIRCLDRYCEAEVSLFAPRSPRRIEQQVTAYGEYLESVRGFARSTIANHTVTAAAFLRHMQYERCPDLHALTTADIEAFIRRVGTRFNRAALQHVVAHLRGFLRFLSANGQAPTGLDTQIDTPRVYRDEQLPRALPWATVQTLLRAIDRTTPCGRRDYAILMLVTTYGLRASEIVALTLDDVEWRTGRLRVAQRKTSNSFWLPLTDEVGAALLDYLRHGRSQLGIRRERRGFQVEPPRLRQLFLRCRTPAGVLKPTAITEVFQACSRRSGLSIPFQGVHCLRHSYATHLLRSGVSLKTIGDLLGHRSRESTCVYLRLATEDLRDVALSLPVPVPSSSSHEVGR
jgi:integrase/recombinase XerD